MLNIPHELSAEFPDKMCLIEHLEQNNYEFRRLTTRYDEINHDIHRIETGEEPTTDEILALYKKHRAKLKDDIAVMLAMFSCKAF